jgi:hypothetical protein
MSAHVFLSHSTANKPAVEELARRLHDKEGIRAWLDKWNLIPGASWQRAMEDALQECESCAVFVGPEGLGPWQTEESVLRSIVGFATASNDSGSFRFCCQGRSARACLRCFVNTTWVEFRGSIDDSEAFHRLVSGMHFVRARSLAATQLGDRGPRRFPLGRRCGFAARGVSGPHHLRIRKSSGPD